MNELVWIVQVVSVLVVFAVNRKVLSGISSFRAFGNFVIDTVLEAHPEARQTFAAAQTEAFEKFPL